MSGETEGQDQVIDEAEAFNALADERELGKKADESHDDSAADDNPGSDADAPEADADGGKPDASAQAGEKSAPGPGDKPKEPQAAPKTHEQRIIEEYRAELKRTQGQVNAIQSQFDKFKAEQAKAARAAQSAPLNTPKPDQTQDKPKDNALQDDPDVKAFEQDYSDIHVAVNKMLKANSAGPSLTKEEVAAIVQESMAAMRPSEDQAGERLDPSAIDDMVTYKLVDMQHPGWGEKVKTPEFKVFMEDQDESIRKLAESASAADAIKLLDHYAEYQKALAGETVETGQAKQGSSSDRLRRAARPVGRSVRPHNAAVVPESEMDEEQLWNHLAEQREAKLAQERGRARR